MGLTSSEETGTSIKEEDVFVFDLANDDDLGLERKKGNELDIDRSWSPTVDHTAHKHWIC